MSSAAASAILEGMPDASDLRVLRSDGVTWVSAGKSVLFRFADDDTGMRNVAVAALRQIGFPGQQVAAALGLTENYVATLHQRALREGTAGLVRPRGRPGRWSPRSGIPPGSGGRRGYGMRRSPGGWGCSSPRCCGGSARRRCSARWRRPRQSPARRRAGRTRRCRNPGLVRDRGQGRRRRRNRAPGSGSGRPGGRRLRGCRGRGRRLRRRAAGCFPGTRGRCCCTPTRGRAPASWPAQRAATCARRRCCGR